MIKNSKYIFLLIREILCKNLWIYLLNKTLKKIDLYFHIKYKLIFNDRYFK